jgi:hypothetical protein
VRVFSKGTALVSELGRHLPKAEIYKVYEHWQFSLLREYTSPSLGHTSHWYICLLDVPRMISPDPAHASHIFTPEVPSAFIVSNKRSFSKHLQSMISEFKNADPVQVKHTFLSFEGTCPYKLSLSNTLFLHLGISYIAERTYLLKLGR